MDQDVGISAPVRYSVQGGILTFLSLNPETADVIMTRPLQDHELVAPTTIVIKVQNNNLFWQEILNFPLKQFLLKQATQIDNPDRYALATVIVSREGGYGIGPTAGKQISH